MKKLELKIAKEKKCPQCLRSFKEGNGYVSKYNVEYCSAYCGRSITED